MLASCEIENLESSLSSAYSNFEKTIHFFLAYEFSPAQSPEFFQSIRKLVYHVNYNTSRSGSALRKHKIGEKIGDGVIPMDELVTNLKRPDKNAIQSALVTKK